MEGNARRWESVKNKVSEGYKQAFGNYYSRLPYGLRPYASVLPIFGIAAAGLIVGCAAGAVNDSVNISGHLKDLGTGEILNYTMNNTSMSINANPHFPANTGEILLSNYSPGQETFMDFGKLPENLTNVPPTLEQVKAIANRKFI